MIEYRLNLSGCECAVVEWNPGGAILVFALHGWLDNLASFEGLVKYMPDIRLVAIDFPGHGHSGHLPPGSAYHFIDGLYLIDDLARHFDCQEINILGHSMGGAIATLYAASQGEKVARLVLIESLGPLTAKPQDSVELMRKAIDQRVALIDKKKPVYKSFDDALTVRAEVSKINKALIKPLVERALVNVDGGYTWRADSRLRVASPLRMPELFLEQVLSQMSASVMLIEGDVGLLTDEPTMQMRKRYFSRFCEHVFPGGHHVHLEQTEAIAGQIQDFFKQID